MASAEEDDIAARFAAIVSPIASTMNWDPHTDVRSEDAVADEKEARERAEAERVATEARERAERRERRREERARELAEFNAEKAELESTYNSDDDHFTPPEPPPLPRLRPATLGAVLLMLAGLALIVFPTLLVIDTQLTMVSRLRAHDDDLDGPNGAVL